MQTFKFSHKTSLSMYYVYTIYIYIYIYIQPFTKNVPSN
jgi:hypothetical protein